MIGEYKDRLRAKGLFGHPFGLTVICLTGMWGVFAVFGSRTVLVYYLVQQLSFEQSQAVYVYALASAGSVVMYVIGGIIADKLLGLRRSVLWGATTMATGLFLLTSAPFLYLALVLIAVGDGLMRPPLVAQVALLYDKLDPRRDRAFTNFKVGTNIGALMAPIACGFVGEIFGWNWAFAVSGVGMVLALVIYTLGHSYLPNNSQTIAQAENVSGESVDIHYSKMIGFLFFSWLGASFFWAAYNQIGGTMAFWIYDDVQRDIQLFNTNLTIPAAWFQSINPLLIFLLAPAVNLLWRRTETSSTTRADVGKLASGTLMLAGSFAILALACWSADGRSVSWLWVFVALIPFTLGELYVDPIGQALFTRIAPRKATAIFASLWFMTYTAGNIAAGKLAELWEIMNPASFFGVTAVLTMIGAIVLWMTRRIAPNGEKVEATSGKMIDTKCIQDVGAP